MSGGSTALVSPSSENTEDAEEAMQDTFVKVYRHIGQFRD